MPINFQRLKAGQPWKVTEPTGRAIIEVAEDWAKHARDVDPAAPPVYEFAGDILEVRNDTGAALPRFSVAGLDGGALILPGSNLIEFQNYPRFSLSTPALPADSGKFCITVEPLPLGAIGLALFSGVVPCQVMLTEGAAPPIFGDATAGQTYLTPATAACRSFGTTRRLPRAWPGPTCGSRTTAVWSRPTSASWVRPRPAAAVTRSPPRRPRSNSY